MIGMIWAQTADRIIGANGSLPWRYPGDFKRFKRVTMGSTIVMGRKTWESIGKPLPGRTNVVVSDDRRLNVVEGITRIGDPMHAVTRWSGTDIWFIGGAQIYAAGMAYADVIDVTVVPDHIQVLAGDCYTVPDPSRPFFQESDIVRAPVVDEALFEPGALLPHEDEPALSRRVYTRRR